MNRCLKRVQTGSITLRRWGFRLPLLLIGLNCWFTEKIDTLLDSSCETARVIAEDTKYIADKTQTLRETTINLIDNASDSAETIADEAKKYRGIYFKYVKVGL